MYVLVVWGGIVCHHFIHPGANAGYNWQAHQTEGQRLKETCEEFRQLGQSVSSVEHDRWWGGVSRAVLWQPLDRLRSLRMAVHQLPLKVTTQQPDDSNICRWCCERGSKVPSVQWPAVGPWRTEEAAICLACGLGTPQIARGSDDWNHTHTHI